MYLCIQNISEIWKIEFKKNHVCYNETLFMFRSIFLYTMHKFGSCASLKHCLFNFRSTELNWHEKETQQKKTHFSSSFLVYSLERFYIYRHVCWTVYLSSQINFFAISTLLPVNLPPLHKMHVWVVRSYHVAFRTKNVCIHVPDWFTER